MMINIVTISFSYKKGGAAIAARKFNNLLLNKPTSFEVGFISQDCVGKFQFLKRLISHALVKLQIYDNPIKHSLNLFSYPSVIKSFKTQLQSIHHLHWINNDTLSVFDFDKIPAGSVITLHDEWLYCGSEHYYKVLDNSNDFKHGYRLFKKNVLGIHWNYLIWTVKYKKLAHRHDLIFTVPSQWMYERAKSSAILRNADVRLLHNPIDSDVFKAATELDANDLCSGLNIDPKKFIFVYGAIGGKKNKLKGVSYLKKAFAMLAMSVDSELASNIVLVDFGDSISEGYLHGFRSISVGHIKQPDHLAKLYSIADCVIVPSMVESFGQVAAEALACETPVVCFDTSGLRDIVLQGETGLVALAFDVKSLMNCLLSMINLPEDERLKLGQRGRRYVIDKFSYPIISKQYLKILEDAVALKKVHAK